MNAKSSVRISHMMKKRNAKNFAKKNMDINKKKKKSIPLFLTNLKKVIKKAEKEDIIILFCLS